MILLSFCMIPDQKEVSEDANKLGRTIQDFTLIVHQEPRENEIGKEDGKGLAHTEMMDQLEKDLFGRYSD